MSRNVCLPIMTRGCGEMEEGGCYFYTITSPFGTLPTAVSIDPPIPVEFPFFRGYRLVHPHCIDLRMEEATWWAETSADVEQQRALRRAEMRYFGMPFSLRKKGGICEGDASLADSEVKYRFRLPEVTPMAGLNIEATLAEFEWDIIPGAVAIVPLLHKRHWGRALATIWKAWLPYEWPFKTNLEVSRLLVTLTGDQREALFLTKLALDRYEQPDKYAATWQEPYPVDWFPEGFSLLGEDDDVATS